MTKEITVKITVKDTIYKLWDWDSDDSDKNNIKIIKRELEKDFKESCNRLGIEEYDIDVTES